MRGETRLLQMARCGEPLSDEAPVSGVNVKSEVDQLIAFCDIGYELAKNLAVLAGLRYNSIDVDLTVRTGSTTLGAGEL
jgi:hypothetical protein